MVELILMVVDPLGSWSVTDVEGISTTRGGQRVFSQVCAPGIVALSVKPGSGSRNANGRVAIG